MKFLILLLLSTSALALKPHTAIYTLSTAGFEIAEVEMVLTKEDNEVYSYTLEAQTKGIISLIKDYQIRSKSVFIINEFGVQSQHYQNFERDGKKVKKDIDFYPKDQQVDVLNQTLAISNALEKNSNQKDFYFLVTNGKSTIKRHYQQVQNRDENLIKVVSLSGDIKVYFARDRYYLPTSIQRKKFSYQLKSIQF